MESIKIECSENKPSLEKEKKIKILNWNVQYLAGKNYVFFYDLLDGSGPHKRPERKDIEITLEKMVALIKKESPDIILLQEVDENAARTDKEDQTKRILEKLNGEYCHAEAFYWKADFVPHPKIMGSVGLKLVTLSKFKIKRATRHQLPVMPGMWIEQQFNFRRAVLETIIETADGGEFAIMNLHLDAFAQGNNTMERQVRALSGLFSEKLLAGIPFIAGGDYNLLAPGQYEKLPVPQRAYFNPDTELRILTEKFSFIPSMNDINSPERSKWFTHFPNDPAAGKPDRTIDYIFYAGVTLKSSVVIQADAMDISDHFPVIMEIEIPRKTE
ncbi:endonuclease/exonuclease/phosphatase family protein [Myxococcota bacterium]|nr:endonuclease/exonuclease/phosphatase family protein [Myxococcota bacterium]